MVLCKLRETPPPTPPFLKHVKTHRESSYCCKHLTNKNNRNKDSLGKKQTLVSVMKPHMLILYWNFKIWVSTSKRGF